MANGKIRFGKQSGGQLALVFPDGVTNTEVVVPESGELATKEYIDNTTVKLTGDQTIAGVKTFSSSPIVPTPTTGTQAVNKEYADLKQSKSELAYNVVTSSYIPNTLASGAIIEIGSNANGEYTKFADGTLMCTGNIPSSGIAVTQARGSLFESADISATFPATFVSTLKVVQNYQSPAGTPAGVMGIFSSKLKSVTFTGAIVSLWSAISVTSGSANILYIAIGRWK